MKNCDCCDEEFEETELTEYKGEQLCAYCIDFVKNEEEEEG